LGSLEGNIITAKALAKTKNVRGGQLGARVRAQGQLPSCPPLATPMILMTARAADQVHEVKLKTIRLSSR